VQKRAFCGFQNTPKCVSVWGSAPDSTGGAHDAPLGPLVSWEGTLLPFPTLLALDDAVWWEHCPPIFLSGTAVGGRAQDALRK